MYGIRDTNYRWIEFSAAEKALIDSPFVQRLRHVSQMASVSLVFPGACTNRFSHSLGVMHLAGLYMDNLLGKIEMETEDKKKYVQLARLCGLLHDIAHGPFSHSFDRTVYKAIYGVEDGGHDIHRLKIIEHPSMKQLIENCGVTGAEIAAVWSGDFKELNAQETDIYRIIANVVQGPLGADRMDFTLRDSRCAGTEHFGTIAYERIINNSSLAKVNGHLCLHYNLKVLPDIVQALSGRFHMYMNVYLHKTVMASGLILEDMMLHAAQELRLVERTKNLEEFQYLNDYIIGEIIALGQRNPNCQAYKYCQRYLTRDLPKLKEEIIKRASVREGVLEMEAGEGEKIIHSKTVENLDAAKFHRRQIYFLDHGRSLSCYTALERLDYPTTTQYLHCIRRYANCF